MPIVKFLYDLDKDVINFINSTHSTNNNRPTRLQQEYINVYGTNYTQVDVRKFLSKYIKQLDITTDEYVDHIEKKWRKIEQIYMNRLNHLFNMSYPASLLQAYLATNQRCTYNIPSGYFFVYMFSKSTNHIIMHELLHFYTWHAFHDEVFMDAGVSETTYNDVKESLTEILNIDFTDLMDGKQDGGYTQHVEMRKKVRDLWNKTKDIRKVVFGLLSSADPISN
jgi:hypothetical protein